MKTLPDGWKNQRLDNISNKISDGIHTTPRYSDSSLYYFINGNNIKNNKIEFFASTKMVSHEEYLKYIKPLGSQTILMSINGTIGSLAFYNDEEVVLGKSVAYINLKKNINKQYIFYALSTENIQRFYESDLTGSTIKNLSIKSIKNTKILLPPLPEQKAIADLLGTWDEAIEKMEQLIEAKEGRFKWLLKELINKPASAPDAEARGWRKVKLGKIGEISSAGVDKKIVSGEKSIRLVNYLDVYQKDFIYSEDLDHQVTAPPFKVIKCQVKKGDIFFTPSSEVNYDIGHSAVAMEDIPNAVYSYHIVRLRLKENWALLYRAYAFKSEYFYKQAQKYCDGSGQRYVISQNSFRKIEIMVPSLSQQKIIGETLYDSQQEIVKLKKLKIKYIEQKRGLMQKVLTGKWRVEV